MLVAVRSTKYPDRPLIGRVIAIGEDDVQIEWMVGTYSGSWKEWKGREGGKTVIYKDSIPKEDILYTGITLTATKKLKASIVNTLKSLYA